MTATMYCAYIFIACYFVIERSLRKGQKALNLKPEDIDAGSSQLLWLGGIINLLLFVSAPVLNAHQFGYWRNSTIGWLGLALMVSGLILRYWAAKTLGQFYTRTLQVRKGQRIVSCPPYSIIRHPGYLGTLLLVIGAGLAVTNWVVLLIGTTLGVASRIYRISVEERLLHDKLNDEYQTYSDRTWRLIPFLY